MSLFFHGSIHLTALLNSASIHFLLTAEVERFINQFTLSNALFFFKFISWHITIRPNSNSSNMLCLNSVPRSSDRLKMYSNFINDLTFYCLAFHIKEFGSVKFFLNFKASSKHKF